MSKRHKNPELFMLCEFKKKEKRQLAELFHHYTMDTGNHILNR